MMPSRQRRADADALTVFKREMTRQDWALFLYVECGLANDSREDDLKAGHETMKQYGFRLLDRNTRKVAKDFSWFSTADAREVEIRQSIRNPRYAIERTERQRQEDIPKRAEEEGELGTEPSST